MHIKNNLVSTLLVVLLTSFVSCKDEYLLESQQACDKSKDFFECAKVRVLKYVTGYTVPINDDSNATSSVKLVKLSEGPEGSGEENVSSTARFMTVDSEPVKFLKFLQRQANGFFSHQGLSIPVPEGARFIDTETGRELGVYFIIIIIIITQTFK